MRKFIPLALIPIIMLACGDDKSSSASDDELSSSSEETVLSSSSDDIASSTSEDQAKESSCSTEITSSTTQEQSSSSTEVSSSSEEPASSTQVSSSESSDDPSAWHYDLTRPLAYIDTTNKRYNYTEGYCTVDNNKKYKWEIKDDPKGVVNYELSDYRDLNKYEPGKLQFIGYKISNDTLYECTSYENDCNDPEDAFVYIGNSSTIFGAWDFIGYLDDGQLHPISTEKTRLEISPESFKIHTSFTMPPFYYTHLHCSLVNEIINDGNFSQLCYEKFTYIDYPNTIVTDTVHLTDNIWIAKLGDDGVITSLNGKIIESHYSYKVDPVTVLKEVNQTVIYNGVECTLSTKQVDIMTKETCENLDPAIFYYDNKFETTNKREFNNCIAEYDIYK